jgi:4,5-dihydroxyphthalate decarboxylase
MARLQLSFACGLYDRMLPIYTGDVRPNGVDLNFIPIDAPREIFDRLAARQEFDVAEMSCSEYVARTAAGQCDYVAIPIFPSRQFRHGLVAINTNSGIEKPKDLEGKRIGVPLYTMTAAIYIKGFLKHDYGVDLSKLQWVQGAINLTGGHGAPTILPLVKPVPIEQNTSGKTLGDLLEAGEIDAVIGTTLPASLRRVPHVRRLFTNFHEVEADYYRRTQIFPVMHLVAIKKSIHERYPFVATSLYKAFDEAKNVSLAKMKNLAALRYMLPWMAEQLDEIEEVFGGDPWPSGIEANRPTLEALVTYLHEQYVTDRRMNVDDLFVQVEGGGH